MRSWGCSWKLSLMGSTSREAGLFRRQAPVRSGRTTGYVGRFDYMWITSDGIPHTVALFDPTVAMQGDFVESVAALSEDDRTRLMVRLGEVEEELLDLLQAQDGDRPSAPEEEPLPEGYLHGTFDSVEAISEYLGGVEVPWRLDALLVVQDLLDPYDPDEPEPEVEHGEPYETVVDGETWVVRHRTNDPGTYDFDWVSGPNEGYGFALYSPDRSEKTTGELDEEIRRFLSEIDPETGYSRH